MAAAKLASPVGINQLLSYLENDGKGAVVRPWFWIMVIFLGLLVNSIGFQVYSYLSAVALIRVEAIITSLVFDHALRIRLKAELPDVKSPARAESVTTKSGINPAGGIEASPAPVLGGADAGREATTASASSRTSVGQHSGSEIAVAPALVTSAPEATSNEQTLKGKETKKDDKTKSTNLIGKINNLVTSDLKSITGGRHFLFLGVYCLLQFFSLRES